MMPFLTKDWGNPSSGYRFGSKLKQAMDNAREQLATLVGVNPASVLFTSCATESNNAAVRAALQAAPGKRHIITAKTEHSSVLSFCKELEKTGFSVTYLPVNHDGLVSVLDLDQAITEQTGVVSLMWANNETGVVSPVEEIASVCRERDVLFHCDAVQAAGKIQIDSISSSPDFLTLSAHKIYGPKGCGALIASEKNLKKPALFGGQQEGGRRGGTENVASIVGFGKAAALAAANLATWSARSNQLRNLLEEKLLAEIQNAWVNGGQKQRLPNTTNIGFPGVNSDAMVGLLDSMGFCVSSGSACLASSLSPSHVVLAMTGSHDKAGQSLRFSVSHLNTEEEIDDAVAAVKKAIRFYHQRNGLLRRGYGNHNSSFTHVSTLNLFISNPLTFVSD
jgi:cysteine desulfurase